MKTLERPVAEQPVIFIADDQVEDYYLYRQAFSEACPTAVLYFFMHKGELLEALRGDIYPNPSLLIMDWHMALRKGYAALSVLAVTPAWQTIPVVIMETGDRPVDEAKCQQMGYELVLPKETRYEKLVEQLTGLMQALV
jgi:CheY-like chemotaxis protein